MPTWIKPETSTPALAAAALIKRTSIDLILMASPSQVSFQVVEMSGSFSRGVLSSKPLNLLCSLLVAPGRSSEMTEFNSMLDEPQRLNFRIGLHLGEVIIDEETSSIFGDGVNVAARIQAMAEPGGIAASRAVRDVAELRSEYAFVDGGEQTMKNVSRSVQIFHVKHAKSAVPVNTTTRMVPQVTLRFEGTDSTKTKHSFEVTLEKLMSRTDGMVIGRSADQCEFVVAHPTVSRRHARLRVAGEALQVEDLGSTNGTRVGEQALKAGEPVPLHAGNKLRIGDIDMMLRHL